MYVARTLCRCSRCSCNRTRRALRIVLRSNKEESKLPSLKLGLSGHIERNTQEYDEEAGIVPNPLEYWKVSTKQSAVPPANRQTLPTAAPATDPRCSDIVALLQDPAVKLYMSTWLEETPTPLIPPANSATLPIVTAASIPRGCDKDAVLQELELAW